LCLCVSWSLLLTLFSLFYVKQNEHFILITLRMYLLIICLFIPMTNTLVTVKIHRNSVYRPDSSCSFFRNASWSNDDASIQSCIWECVNEYNCQTAVYFNKERVCSMFAELCKTDNIQPSENWTSVICYRKNHGNYILKIWC
jgi:hypothetical protein